MPESEDYFEPAIQSLRRVAARADGGVADAGRALVDECLRLISDLATSERAEALENERDVVPREGGRSGDTGALAATIVHAADQLIRTLNGSEQQVAGFEVAPAPAPVAVLYEPALDLARSCVSLGRACGLSKTDAQIRAVEAAKAELGLEYAQERQAALEAAASRAAAQLKMYEARAVAVVDRADDALVRAERTAGLQSQEELAAHFAAVEKSERTSAKRLRMAAGAVGVSGPILGVMAVAFAQADHLLVLPVSVSVAGLGVYLGRLAEGHMAIARWARTLEVQTRGVHGYTRLISDGNAQDRVLEGFGLHAYTGHPGESVGRETPLSAVTEVERLVRLVLEVQQKTSPPPK